MRAYKQGGLQAGQLTSRTAYKQDSLQAGGLTSRKAYKQQFMVILIVLNCYKDVLTSPPPKGVNCDDTVGFSMVPACGYRQHKIQLHLKKFSFIKTFINFF